MPYRAGCRVPDLGPSPAPSVRPRHGCLCGLDERPGDLVFFAGADGTMTSPGHVGIVVGTGLMIDAPTAGMDVQVQRIDSVLGLVGYTDPAAADSSSG